MTALLAPQVRYTEEEYFTFEADSVTKHEFYRGEVFAMAGTSFAHVMVASNLFLSLGSRLAGKPCRPLNSDLRVKVSSEDLITYPDISVVCGPPELVRHPQGEAITNPSVIFEVLSDSTEAYDRGRKFSLYRQLPSLRAYVLAAQDEAVVEVFTWAQPGSVLMREFRGLDAIAEIPALSVSLRLAEIYRDMELAPRLRVLEAARGGAS